MVRGQQLHHGGGSDCLCWVKAGSVQSRAADGCQEQEPHTVLLVRARARTHTRRESWISARGESKVCVQHIHANARTHTHTFGESEPGFVPALRRGASGVCLEGLTASR